MKIQQLLYVALFASPLILADVVVVGHLEGPSSLDANQIRDLYTGRASQLPDGKSAVPLDLEAGSALREEFHTKVTGRSQAQLNAFWAQQVFTGKGHPPRTVDSTTSMKATVAATPGAVGYIEAGEVDGSVKVLLTP